MLKKVAIGAIMALFSLSFSYANTLDESLVKGLKALENHNATKAMAWQKQLPEASEEYKILSWAISLSGLKTINSSYIYNTIENLKNWPTPNLIRANYERALYREYIDKHNFTPEQAHKITAYFNDNHPATSQGLCLYIKSARLSKDLDIALPYLRHVWLSKIFTAQEQKNILTYSKNLLSPIDHFHRLERLLLKAKFSSARQLAPAANAEKLTNSFIANNLASLKENDKYGMLYQYAFIKNAIKQQNFELAGKALLKIPKDPNYLVCPDIWARLSLGLAHDLTCSNQAKLALHIIKFYDGEQSLLASESAFYAGWICLRRLYKPKLAIKYFLACKKYSKHNNAKANYWLGRAYEYAAQPKLALFYYKQAANYNYNFYGQIAAANLPHYKFNISGPTTSASMQASFNKLEAVQILKKLQKIKDKKYAHLLSLALAKQLNNSEYLAFLISMSTAANDYYTALRIAKIAAARNFNIGVLSHPLAAIDDIEKLKPKDKAIIYAIARQESEFNSAAISSAGARGLMQLMPLTAKELCRSILRKKFSLRKLTASPSYNAKLGLTLVKQNRKYFDGSYLLSFTAYNAGRRKVTQWVEKYGNPQKMNLQETIDWIENIPYKETRNYIKHIFENYEIYKYLLGLPANLKKDLN